jgi:hypothetical protein
MGQLLPDHELGAWLKLRNCSGATGVKFAVCVCDALEAWHKIKMCELLVNVAVKSALTQGKQTDAYPQDHYPDPSAKGDNVVQRYVLVIALHNTGPDKMPPVSPNSARTKK